MGKKIISWNEVKAFHKTVAGIYAFKNRAISLLVNCDQKAPYPNKVTEKEITYYFGSSTQGWGIAALLKSVENSDKIRVFQKFGVNEWQDLGCWVPTVVGDEKEGFWPVKLVPAK